MFRHSFLGMMMASVATAIVGTPSIPVKGAPQADLDPNFGKSRGVRDAKKPHGLMKHYDEAAHKRALKSLEKRGHVYLNSSRTR